MQVKDKGDGVRNTWLTVTLVLIVFAAGTLGLLWYP